jgi:hypothetical protein
MDQATVALNQTGIAFLDKGDLENALLSFREALFSAMVLLESSREAKELPSRSIKPDAMTSSPIQVSAGAENAEDAAMSNEALDPSHTVHLVDWSSEMRDGNHRFFLAQSISAPTAAAAMAGSPFVHARGLPIFGMAGAYSDDVMLSASCVSAILIFNLGVVYHVKAMQGGTVSSNSSCGTNCLTKAKTLYTHSLTLLHQSRGWDCCTVNGASAADPVMDLLSMALFNNLGHVCYEQSNYEESRLFFQDLVGFALTVTPSGYDNDDDSLTLCMNEYKKHFLLNAMILNARPTAPAA